LRPYSTKFREELGYDLSVFEVRFAMLAGGISNPDAIVLSQKVHNTLLIEWTEAKNIQSKEEQLERYSRIGSTDLTDILGLPPDATSNFNVVLILKKTTVGSFRKFLEDNGWIFPILSFESQANNYSLEKAANSFSEIKTDDFFSAGINVSRIPTRYLPFSLEDVSEKAVVSFIVQHLLHLALQEEREFTISKFCSGYIPVWQFIAVHKQRHIRDVTRRLLRKLYGTSVGKRLLIEVSTDPTIWQVQDIQTLRPKIRSLRTELNQFIDRMKHNIQLEFDLDDMKQG
jgi:hypothetical protein